MSSPAFLPKNDLLQLAGQFEAVRNPKAALSFLQKAHEAEPQDHALALRYANALQQAGDMNSSEGVLQTVLAHDPGHSDALSQLAGVLIDLGRHEEARHLLVLLFNKNPHHVGGRAQLARSLFYQGEWQQAWKVFQVRFRLMDRPPEVRMPGPEGKARLLAPWKEGQPPASLLVMGEQGFGDMIQFVRFLPHLAAKGAAITLVTDRRLFKLLSTLDVPVQFAPVDKPGQVQGIRGWVPLLNLPMALGLDPNEYRAEAPYLKAEPDRVKRWRAHIGSHGFKIGIAWQGNPQGSIDQGRSARLEDFLPLTNIPDARLISLQKGQGSEQVRQGAMAGKVEILPPGFDAGEDAFLDTAALMQSLDLVITVDTAIGHLAGALGIKAMILLKRYGSDWRWQQGHEDTVWYPSITLKRQKRQGDWHGLIAEIAAGLQSRSQPLAPVSIGELIDKLTILEIKLEKIVDAVKRANIEREKTALDGVLGSLALNHQDLSRLQRDLKNINLQLWNIEDDIRLCERYGNFGRTFVELARSVYRMNDQRAALKKQINACTGSVFVEEKSYA